MEMKRTPPVVSGEVLQRCLPPQRDRVTQVRNVAYSYLSCYTGKARVKGLLNAIPLSNKYLNKNRSK